MPSHRKLHTLPLSLMSGLVQVFATTALLLPFASPAECASGSCPNAQDELNLMQVKNIVQHGVERLPKEAEVMVDHVDLRNALVLSLSSLEEETYSSAPEGKMTTLRRLAPLQKSTEPPNLDGYTIKKEIGKGKFGAVFSAESDTGKTVAIKQLLLPNINDKEIQKILTEVTIQRAVQPAPQVVEIFDVVGMSGPNSEFPQALKAIVSKEQEGPITAVYIVMELLPSGELYGKIQESKVGLGFTAPRYDAQQVFQQLALGLHEVHDKGFVHLDMKPENVFLDDDDGANIAKIGDFGFATELAKSEQEGSIKGSPLYTAPEIFRNAMRTSQQRDSGQGIVPVGTKADVWSAGVMLYEMLTGGSLPYDNHRTVESLSRAVVSGPQLLESDFLQKGIFGGAAKLLESMLQQDPTKRPSMMEAKEQLDEAVLQKRAKHLALLEAKRQLEADHS